MSLYPKLAGVVDDSQMSVREEQPQSGEGHRLQQIAELKYRLEKERDFRASMYKKYHRGVNIVDSIDAALITASLGLGASGVGLLATIIAAPIVVGMEAAAVVCGLTGVAGKVIARRLQNKAKKHDEIRVLAESKLNTIYDHVSKALQDNTILDEEFSLILSEVEKYNQMKTEIRSRNRRQAGISEEEKNLLIKQGRDEALLSMQQTLAADLQ